MARRVGSQAGAHQLRQLNGRQPRTQRKARIAPLLPPRKQWVTSLVGSTAQARCGALHAIWRAALVPRRRCGVPVKLVHGPGGLAHEPVPTTRRFGLGLMQLPPASTARGRASHTCPSDTAARTPSAAGSTNRAPRAKQRRL